MELSDKSGVLLLKTLMCASFSLTLMLIRIDLLNLLQKKPEHPRFSAQIPKSRGRAAASAE